MYDNKLDNLDEILRTQTIKTDSRRNRNYEQIYKNCRYFISNFKISHKEKSRPILISLVNSIKNLEKN